jgi:uncharacterized protein with ParB-like and HNH nuclease domain
LGEGFRVKISTALDKMDDRQLFVPAFQREYVWRRDDANLLIDSLSKQYPLKLFQRVITVSLETMKIVRGLPKLELMDA